MEILQCTNCKLVFEASGVLKERDDCSKCGDYGYLMNPDDSDRYEVVDKSDIIVGDAILHKGHFRTISSKYIKNGFMGTTLFGDSFKFGMKKVLRLKI